MKRALLLFILSVVPLHLFPFSINILDMGAKGDGITDNTSIIQNAINAVSAKGGGTVYVPSGKYLTKALEFKSDVHLYLDAGAVLLGSTCLEDYANAFPILDGKLNQTSGLIWGRRLENISITGLGTIDGQGEHPNFQHGNDADGGPKRPKLIYFVECRDIRVSNITLKNYAYWVQHYEKCENVQITGLKVYSHCNYNNDGLDIDGKNILVSDCIIDVEDDAICLKSDHETFCENITITNCITASNCNAIKLGTASHGGFRNIVVSNCVVHRASEDNIRHWSKQLEHISADVTVISGIAIEVADGGIIDGVTISNMTMRDVQTPIFIKLGDRRRTFRKEIGVLRNINIDNIVAIAESLIPCSITGVEGGYVENVSISNIQITFPGGGTRSMFEKPVPENKKRYPENRMFGNTLPASGFYVRHVKDIRFDNIFIKPLSPDVRPQFFLDDVAGGYITRSGKNRIYHKNCSEIYQDENIVTNQ